jgi:hypothetical protein
MILYIFLKEAQYFFHFQDTKLFEIEAEDGDFNNPNELTYSVLEITEEGKSLNFQ